MLNHGQLLKIGLIAGVVIALVSILTWLPGATAATYEIHPEIPLEIHGTPAAMVAAYERLTDQYLCLVQDHLLGMAQQMRQMTRTLEMMDRKLAQLNERITRLEAREQGRRSTANTEQGP